MRYIAAQFGELFPAQRGSGLGKVGSIFFVHLGGGSADKKGKMRQTQSGLLIEQMPEIPLGFPEPADCGEHTAHRPVDFIAYKAGVGGARRTGSLLAGGLAQKRKPFKYLVFDFGQMGFQHQRHP